METLLTPRLRLRPPRDEDAEALSAGSNRLDVARWLIRVPHPNPPEAVRVFLARIRAAGARVHVVDDGAPRGLVGLDPELGYWIAPEAQGLGYATEAAAAVVAEAFARGAETLAAGHLVGNHRSARVLSRLGFRETGRGRVAVASTGEEAEQVEMALARAAFAAAAPGLPLTPAARSGIAAP
ncbi:MAG TPA: GNAT family N-acetyltransferase [Paracoccaceae bacterium]|nr:GNAT family N-acetyltransferase [Paracoccaceae bacterium]